MPWPIIGHAWAVAHLRRSLASGRGAHAYLFSGPPQIGKTTLGRALAQALNCPRPDPPCGECPSCTKASRLAHPDIQVVVGKGVGEAIQIDQIRALQREAILTPYEGRYRVLILRHMERATPEAANSLLKTLEEPPPHVVLILTAIRPEALPPTVVSRCQRLSLRPVPAPVIEASLGANAHLVAHLSGGRVGWAISAMQNEAILQQRQADLNLLLELLPADRVTRLEHAAKNSRDPASMRRQIERWTVWWHDVLLLASQGASHVVNIDQLEALHRLAQQVAPQQAWRALERLLDTVEQLEANVNPRMALEGLVLKLPYVER